MGEKEEEEEEQETERKEKVVSPSETEDKPLTSPKQKEHTPARRERNEPDSGIYLLSHDQLHMTCLYCTQA